MDNIVCSKCHTENKSTRHFCEKCGAFLHPNDYDEKVYALPEMKMMRVVDNLLNMPHRKVNWSAVADAYAYKVEKFKALFNIPGMGAENNSAVVEKMNNFLKLCYNPDFQIAFVGTIKTGKSTLINALLGKNYASMDVTPETAALTRFRSSPRDYVNITFYTQSEWEKLWASRTDEARDFMREYEALDAESQKSKWINHAPIHKEMMNEEIEQELTIWSSSKRAEHYFVKEIEVGISTLPKEFPSQVIFVDTPGLSDPVAYRSELTQEYIRRANAVFVCVDAQKILQEEVKTIEHVIALSAHEKGKVYVIATHWDKLNEPETEWVRQKAFYVRRLNGPAFFESEEMAERNIMHSAAFIYNLCRDYDSLDPKNPDDKKKIKSLQKFALDYDYEIPADLDNMKAKTNIHQIQEVIFNDLARNYEKLLIGDIKHSFLDVVYNLNRVTQEKQDSMNELLKTSQASEETIKQKLQEQRKKCEDVKRVSGQLKEIMKKVKQRTNTRADTICGKLRLSLSQKK